MPSTIRAPRINEESDAPRGGALHWGAHIAVRLPEGVTRHPLLLDRVDEQLGRIAALDLTYAGVRIAVGLRGEERYEAEQDCDTVVARLLRLLGLPITAIEEHVVFERDPSLLEDRQGLRVVADLPKHVQKV